MACIVLYALVGEAIAKNAPLPSVSIYFGVAFASIGIMVSITILRRILVVPAERALSQNLADAPALVRWRTGYILTYALSEAVALLGLVLRLLGFTFSQVATFYAVGLILLMFFGPRRPSNVLG